MMELHFDSDTGLVPAIVQSAADGRVLMLGYMNREALAVTMEEGRVIFFSRARGTLWRKGETSGNWLEVIALRADCDRDAVLVTAVPHGPTCHTAAESCFDTGDRFNAGDHSDAGSGTPDPTDGGKLPAPRVDGDERLWQVLGQLVQVIRGRDRDRPTDSYTAKLLSGGVASAAQKVGEEAIETALTAVAEPGRLAEESADLLFHLFVLWRAAGLRPGEVAAVLEARRGMGPGACPGNTAGFSG